MKIVEALITIGKAKINYCCKINPFIACIKRMKYVIAKFLVEQGADINWRQPGEESCIQIAIDQNNTVLLKEILDSGKLKSIDCEYLNE